MLVSIVMAEGWQKRSVAGCIDPAPRLLVVERVKPKVARVVGFFIHSKRLKLYLLKGSAQQMQQEIFCTVLMLGAGV